MQDSNYIYIYYFTLCTTKCKFYLVL